MNFDQWVFQEFPTLQAKHASMIEDFRVEIMHGVQYMRIKLKHFQKSKNRGLIAEIHAPGPRFLLSSATPIVGTKCEQLERQEVCRLGDRLTSDRPFR